MPICIKGGRIVDPGRINGLGDLWVDGDTILDIDLHPVDTPPKRLSAGLGDDINIIDATGKIVVPGFIDIHVHLREPGQEHKETIETGCRAAAHGGFSAVCAMPNTTPPNDRPQITEFIKQKAATGCGVRVYPVAAISRDLKGAFLCDLSALKTAGAIAVSDDGYPVMNSRLMRQAMEAAGDAGLLVISHSEDLHLAHRGVMNEGHTCRSLGIKGIPNAAESIMVMRDIALCELTGTPLHIAHISTRESIRSLRDAKERGVPVTGETAPHYFTLTDEAVATYGANAKMNPPLRSDRDREAVIQGLVDGTIDAIATDHAPHSPDEKAQPIETAPNGIIGLETSVGLGLQLVDRNVLTLEEFIEKMAVNPARIIGMDNRLKAGNPADITILDTEAVSTVQADRFQSMSRNCPFDGWELKGRAVGTMVAGKMVYQDL